MAIGTGRIACPQCGANNFDTVTVCWKCGVPLRRGSAAGQPAPPNAAGGTPSVQVHQPVAAGPRMGASPAALRAALWLGLLFPYVGLPVGLVFMMLDDESRYEAGRACVLWSCVSLAAHFIVMALIGVGMREMLFAALQGVRGVAGRAGGMGGYDAPAL